MPDTYLVRFFRHPKTGKQQRHTMLDDCSWALGEWIGPEDALDARFARVNEPDFMESMTKALQGQRFYEDRFEYKSECVAAFERLSAAAVKEGYELVDMVDRMVDVIPDDAKPKPDWQHALDQFQLDTLRADAKKLTVATDVRPDEPYAMLLRAGHLYRQKLNDEARALALAARDEVAARKAAKQPYYIWSLQQHEFEARIHELLFLIYNQHGDKEAMLASIRRAVDLSLSTERSEYLAWVQCWHFPQYRQDAFETAYSYAEFGYDVIKQHPNYAAFAAQRDAEVAAGLSRWFWNAMTDPSSDTEIASAETALGASLPEDYKAFLSERGQSELNVEYPAYGENIAQHKELKFCRAADLAIWASVFRHWTETMSKGAGGDVTAEWPAKHSVDRADLVSVATPRDNSRCLLMCIKSGPHFGACYLWDHDEPVDLVPFAPTFDAAVKRVVDDFTAGHQPVLSFLDIYAAE